MVSRIFGRRGTDECPALRAAVQPDLEHAVPLVPEIRFLIESAVKHPILEMHRRLELPPKQELGMTQDDIDHATPESRAKIAARITRIISKANHSKQELEKYDNQTQARANPKSEAVHTASIRILTSAASLLPTLRKNLDPASARDETLPLQNLFYSSFEELYEALKKYHGICSQDPDPTDALFTKVE